MTFLSKTYRELWYFGQTIVISKLIITNHAGWELYMYITCKFIVLFGYCHMEYYVTTSAQITGMRKITWPLFTCRRKYKCTTLSAHIEVWTHDSNILKLFFWIMLRISSILVPSASVIKISKLSFLSHTSKHYDPYLIDD